MGHKTKLDFESANLRGLDLIAPVINPDDQAAAIDKDTVCKCGPTKHKRREAMTKAVTPEDIHKEATQIRNGLWPVALTESRLDEAEKLLEEFQMLIEQFTEETMSDIQGLRTQLIEGGCY